MRTLMSGGGGPAREKPVMGLLPFDSDLAGVRYQVIKIDELC